MVIDTTTAVFHVLRACITVMKIVAVSIIAATLTGVVPSFGHDILNSHQLKNIPNIDESGG